MIRLGGTDGAHPLLKDSQTGAVIFRRSDGIDCAVAGWLSSQIGLVVASGAAGGIYPGVIGFNSSSNNLAGGASDADTYFTRQSSNVMQFDRDVDADADDYTLKSADGITGTNRSGGDLTLASGNATGTGTSAVIISTPASGATGTTARTAAERLRVNSSGVSVTGGAIISQLSGAAPALVWAAAHGELGLGLGGQPNVPDPSGVTSAEDVEARAAINAILSQLEALGLFTP
jgi:hypothetical protein